jgi:hypothetical protein
MQPTPHARFLRTQLCWHSPSPKRACSHPVVTLHGPSAVVATHALRWHDSSEVGGLAWPRMWLLLVANIVFDYLCKVRSTRPSPDRHTAHVPSSIAQVLMTQLIATEGSLQATIALTAQKVRSRTHHSHARFAALPTTRFAPPICARSSALSSSRPHSSIPACARRRGCGWALAACSEVPSRIRPSASRPPAGAPRAAAWEATASRVPRMVAREALASRTAAPRAALVRAVSSRPQSRAAKASSKNEPMCGRAAACQLYASTEYRRGAAEAAMENVSSHKALKRHGMA